MAKFMVVSVALFLTGCTAVGNVFNAVTGGIDFGAYSGSSQIETMEQRGLRKEPYVLGMNLVPCMKMTDTGHIKMTMDERFDYKSTHGGYMADCGVKDDFNVWG